MITTKKLRMFWLDLDCKYMNKGYDGNLSETEKRSVR